MRSATKAAVVVLVIPAAIVGTAVAEDQPRSKACRAGAEATA